MKEVFGFFVVMVAWFFSIAMCVWTERNVNSYYFGMSRFDIAEKIKQCEADLARNERCKVIVIVERP